MPDLIPLGSLEAKPLNVVVFGSGSGLVLKGLIEQQKKFQEDFVIKAVFSDKKCDFQKIAEEAGIPVLYLSFKKFFNDKKIDNFQDLATRREFDAKIAALLQDFQKRQAFCIDLVILAGYMHVLHEPVLNPFKNKIFNIHPADLTQLDQAGQRKYIGMDQIAQAIKNGEKRTRTTVHLVREGADTGPILVLGPWVNWEGQKISADEIKRHQMKQKIQSDLPACLAAISLIAQGRLSLDPWDQVYLDEKKLPSGYDLETYSFPPLQIINLG